MVPDPTKTQAPTSSLYGAGDDWPHEEVWGWPDNYRLCFPDHRAEAKFFRDIPFSELDLIDTGDPLHGI